MCAVVKTKKSKVHKAKRISIALPEREDDVLNQYAQNCGISRTTAVKRIVREALKQYSSNLAKTEPKNQLGLFDTLQMDIFFNTSKASY